MNTQPKIDALPPPERGQHDELLLQEVTGPGGGVRAQVRYPRRIDKYFAHGELGRDKKSPEGQAENVRNYAAAVTYLELSVAARAHSCQSTLGNLDRVDSAPIMDAVGNRIDAFDKFTRAQSAVGPNHVSCLDAIICEDQPAHRWRMDSYYRQRERLLADGKRPKRTKPRKSEGIRCFREALESLANHWRL